MAIKICTLSNCLVTAKDSTVVRNFVYSTGGQIVDRISAFGNVGSPIVPRQIVLTSDNLLFVAFNFQGGLLDLVPPIIRIQKTLPVLQIFIEIIGSFFPNEVMLQGLPADTYDVVVDMAAIVDGGVGYVIGSVKGSIS